MGTRANIRIKDEGNFLLFYRHSDGFPSDILPSLFEFMRWVVDGKIRRDAIQASGWLVILGNREHGATIDANGPSSWQVGAYEPTPDLHLDSEWLYDLDLYEAKITVYKLVGDLDLTMDEVIKHSAKEYGTFTKFSVEDLARAIKKYS